MTAQSDLLANVVNPQSSYPWDVADPATDDYFAAIDESLDDPAVEAAIAAGWQRFSVQLETLWGTSDSVTEQITHRLMDQFQARMPADILAQIAAQAADLSRQGQALIDQLVVCASTILPTWDADDLAVLARPLAFALRDGQGEMLDLTLRTLPQTHWEALSEIEQARLTLAIATVALRTAAEAD